MADKERELTVFEIVLKTLEYRYQKMIMPISDDVYTLFLTLMGAAVPSESPDIIIGDGAVGIEHMVIPAQGRKDQDALQRAQNMSDKSMHRFQNEIISLGIVDASENLFNETLKILSKTKLFQGCEYHNALRQLERVLSTHNKQESTYRSKCKKLIYLLEITGPIYGCLYAYDGDHHALKNKSAPVICPENIDVFNILTDSTKCCADYVITLNPWWRGGYISVLNCKQPEKIPMSNRFQYIPLCRCFRNRTDGMIKRVEDIDVLSAFIVRNISITNQQNSVIDISIYNEISSLLTVSK
jgi:hypothetical protein